MSVSEPRAGERALEQVVAQQRVLRHPAGHRRVERVDVVDALAGEGSFREQVLVDVGDGGGVRIDARRAGERPLEDRGLMFRGEGRRDARLEHAVAVRDPPGSRIEGRRVERMGDRPDQAADRTGRQSRVGVERDHVADVRRCGRGASLGHEDAGRRRPTQQRVQLLELAALAFPAHPAALDLVPAAASMQQQEAGASARCVAVALVEPIDSRGRGRQELVVAGNLLGRRVEPVREQGEAEIAVAVREVVQLEPADLGLDVRLVGQQRGHHDERAHLRRDALGQIEPGQRTRPEGVGQRPVDEGDGEIRCRQQREEGHDEQTGTHRAAAGRQQQGHGEERCGDQRDRGRIPDGGATDQAATQSTRERHPDLEGRLELRDSRPRSGSSRGPGGGRNRPRRHRRPVRGDAAMAMACRATSSSARPALARELLDPVSIPIPGGEVHARERAVGPEDLVDEADALDELRPVEPRDEAHARDHIADGHVHRCLALMLEADHLFGGRPLLRKELLEPAHRGRGVRVLVAQPLEELNARRPRESRP